MSLPRFLPVVRLADTTLKGVQLKIEDPWSFLVGDRIIDHSWPRREPILQRLMVAAGDGRWVIFRGVSEPWSQPIDCLSWRPFWIGGPRAGGPTVLRPPIPTDRQWRIANGLRKLPQPG